MYYSDQRIRREKGNPLIQSYFLPFILLIISLIILSCKVESRAVDGSDNNINNPTSGTPKQRFQRKFPTEPFFG
jgi:hypothetical protein